MMASVLISVKPTKRFKIPNREVMVDWARWVIGNVEGHEGILNACTMGPVSAFVGGWPDFMQQRLDPKAVAKARGAVSSKTPEKIYHVYLLCLLCTLEQKGWKVTMGGRAGGGLSNVRFLREYGIASYHLESHVEGRYLELDAQRRWVEKDDPQDMLR
jgi:hypothetical protein